MSFIPSAALFVVVFLITMFSKCHPLCELLKHLVMMCVWSWTCSLTLPRDPTFQGRKIKIPLVAHKKGHQVYTKTFDGVSITGWRCNVFVTRYKGPNLVITIRCWRDFDFGLVLRNRDQRFQHFARPEFKIKKTKIKIPFKISNPKP